MADRGVDYDMIFAARSLLCDVIIRHKDDDISDGMSLRSAILESQDESQEELVFYFSTLLLKRVP